MKKTKRIKALINAYYLKLLDAGADVSKQEVEDWVMKKASLVIKTKP